MSALEGGYRIQGGPVSAFARSVAAHVRALAAASRHSQAWHPADSNVSPFIHILLIQYVFSSLCVLLPGQLHAHRCWYDLSLPMPAMNLEAAGRAGKGEGARCSTGSPACSGSSC
jgi:hypothetical protein